jgi:hypothetical protein
MHEELPHSALLLFNEKNSSNLWHKETFLFIPFLSISTVEEDELMDEIMC